MEACGGGEGSGPSGKIPWMEEPGRLQSMGSLRVDTTRRLHFHFSLSCIGEGNGNPLQYSCLDTCQVPPIPRSAFEKDPRPGPLFEGNPVGEGTTRIHSSVLAWRIPGTGESGGLLSMGSHRVRYD